MSKQNSFNGYIEANGHQYHYSGYFKGGKANGSGTLKIKDIGEYRGSFENGYIKQNELGSYTSNSGEVFFGKITCDENTLTITKTRFSPSNQPDTVTIENCNFKHEIDIDRAERLQKEKEKEKEKEEKEKRAADAEIAQKIAEFATFETRYKGGFDDESGSAFGCGKLNIKGVGRYQGLFLEGVPSGPGILETGYSTYEGNFIGGKAAGYGKLTIEGVSYEGMFKNGFINGQGQLTDEPKGEYKVNQNDLVVPRLTTSQADLRPPYRVINNSPFARPVRIDICVNREFIESLKKTPPSAAVAAQSAEKTAPSAAKAVSTML